MAKHKASSVRIHGTTFGPPEERDPVAEAREDLTAEIIAHPACQHIVNYLAHAKALGFDPADPDVIRRAMSAGVAAYDEEQRTREYELSLRALAEHDEANPVHPSLVYYMRMGGLIKIGTTTWLAQRVQQLKPQGVIAVEPGGPAEEKQRHQEFADLREHGEWFRMDPRLGEHIAGLREQFQAEMSESLEIWLRRQKAPSTVQYRRRAAMIARRQTDALKVVVDHHSDPTLLPAAQAARAVGVSPQLFNMWRRIGKVTPAAVTAQGRKLFKLTDVLEASLWKAPAR